MKKFQKFPAALTAIVLTAAVFFASCKKNFDQPPYQTDPAIVANTSIKDLKARHTVSGGFDVISTDLIISGTVIADDKSGNLYKEIYIQDSTGALQINLDAASLYGTYPVGRKVFIKCNGLCLSDYHNTMFLGIKATVSGAPSAEAIPAALISSYVIGGSLNNPVVPKVVTIADLALPTSQPWQQPLIGNLIQLNDYQFQASDTSKTYADTSYYKASNDLYISSCATPTQTVDVRSSGYANFAAVPAAKGRGTILAIYAPYNTTKQVIIRDTSDIRFTGARCGGVVVPPVGTQITMTQLRALHPTAADVTLTSANGYVIGKVVSNSANEASGNYRIQDDTGAGVVLYAASGSPVYPLGTVLTINLAGGKLTLYNGDLELSNVPLAQVGLNTTATINATPVVRTVADIIANRNTISSTMVKINNLTSIVAGTSNTTGTNYTVKDATGTLVMFVRTAAGITVNTAGTSITGYVSLYNTDTQIGIRSTSDIQ